MNPYDHLDTKTLYKIAGCVWCVIVLAELVLGASLVAALVLPTICVVIPLAIARVMP